MKISRINLKEYKHFKNLTIDLGEKPKRIIALIGPNGCGKSSVFDGISFLTSQYGASYGTSTRIPSNYHTNRSDKIVDSNNVKIIFENGENYYNVYDRFRKENKERTIFSFRSPYRYTSSLKIRQLKSIPDIKLNENGAQYCFDLDDKMTNNFQFFYSLINKYMKKNRTSATYDEAINVYLDEVNKSLKNCLDIEIVEVGEIIDGDGTLYFKKSNQIGVFDYNVLSSGEKEVVDMLIDLVVKKNDFVDSIFLFDEPELHINTSIQRKLLCEINRLVPENCQIWIATHSIGFLRALEEDFVDNSQIIKFNGNYSIEEVFLKPMLRTRNNFLELYRTAVDDIAELISPKQIVYCEGKISEECDGLDEYCYNSIFSILHPNTFFISAGGCSELNKYSNVALMLINKAFSGVEILILKDKDIKGLEGTTEEDRQKFLEDNPNNRMLKRREIENYLLDYEIVSKIYPEITKEFYNGLVSDVKTQDLKLVIKDFLTLCQRKDERGFDKEAFLKSLVPAITPDTKIYKELEEIIFNK